MRKVEPGFVKNPTMMLSLAHVVVGARGTGVLPIFWKYCRNHPPFGTHGTGESVGTAAETERMLIMRSDTPSEI